MNLIDIINDLTNIYPTILSTDLIRYVVGAGGVYLLINILLSNRLAKRKIREKSPPKGQIRRELLASMRTVCIFAANGTIIVWGAGQGIFQIYTDIEQFGWTYLAMTTIILILLHDAWFYWTHRIFHYPPIFRHFHRLHHQSHNPTPFASYSFNVGESIISASYFLLMLLILPAHPIALFIFTTHMMLRNAVGHSGYELFPSGRDGKPRFDWMTTVTHHDLHHAQAGYNMGLYFTWWDRWMGTEHPQYYAEFLRVTKPNSSDQKYIPQLKV